MKWKIISIVLLTSVLLYIPYASNFVKVFNTMFHEGGHAIAALLTGSHVKSISLFSNVEGVATTQSSSWFSTVITSMSGYVIAAIVGLLFALLWKNHKHKTILWSVAIFSIISLVLWVRNPFGIAWLLVSSSLLLFILLRGKNKKLFSWISLVLTLVLITESVLSSFDIVLISYHTPDSAGDAYNLASSTLIPTLIWGILFFIQSLVFAFFSYKAIWKTEETYSWKK